jgi:hypothetical protein
VRDAGVLAAVRAEHQSERGSDRAWGDEASSRATAVTVGSRQGQGCAEPVETPACAGETMDENTKGRPIAFLSRQLRALRRRAYQKVLTINR